MAGKKDTASLLGMLHNILKKYHYQNRKISYLKLDVDVSELIGLPRFLSEDALKIAQHIAAEVHFTATESTIAYLQQCKTFILKEITN